MANGGNERNLLDNMVNFINTKRIEASIPDTWRRGKVRLDGYERIGGTTNRNYKIFIGSEVLVLRLPGRGTGRFISRADEMANQAAATRAGFSPESVYFNERSGVKITPFIDDAASLTPQTARDPHIYTRVAHFLSGFHRSEIRFVNRFDVFQKLRTYEKVAKSRFVRFYPEFRKRRDAVFALEAEVRRLQPPPVACHNDLVPENILDYQDTFQLIDWEYSGTNDPAWDIGSFLLETEMPWSDGLSFIEAYHAGRTVPEQFLWRVRAYQVLQDMLWALWSLIQESALGASPKRARDYHLYGAVRYQRCITMLQTLRD